MSGLGTVVDGARLINRFQVTEINNATSWVGSGVREAYTHIDGNPEWWGSMWGMGGYPGGGVYPGTQFSFKGLGDVDNGCSGTARCERIIINVDRATGTAVNYQAFFRCDGALTRGATTAADPGGDLPSGSIDALLKFGGVDQAAMFQAQLDITNKLRRYYSGTGGLIRHDRGNQQTSFAYRTRYDSPAELPSLGTNYSTQLYVSTTKYWTINWLKIIGNVDMNFPRREQARGGDQMAAAEVRMGLVGTTASTAIGAIIDPEGVTRWPFA